MMNTFQRQAGWVAFCAEGPLCFQVCRVLMLGFRLYGPWTKISMSHSTTRSLVRSAGSHILVFLRDGRPLYVRLECQYVFRACDPGEYRVLSAERWQGRRCIRSRCRCSMACSQASTRPWTAHHFESQLSRGAQAPEPILPIGETGPHPQNTPAAIGAIENSNPNSAVGLRTQRPRISAYSRRDSVPTPTTATAPPLRFLVRGRSVTPCSRAIASIASLDSWRPCSQGGALFAAFCLAQSDKGLAVHTD